MDQKLIEAIAESIPPINQSLLDGYALKEMRHVEAYIDRAIRNAEADFPEGLKCIDYRRMTPLETYLSMTEERGGRSQFDAARSDIYMVALNFEFKGRKITKPLLLPFLRDGALLSIRGATYSISPILADKGISFTENSAFIHIPRARLTFKRLRHHFLAVINNQKQRRHPVVIFSRIHNLNKKRTPQNQRLDFKLETTLAHYLFSKFGFYQTFYRFLNTDIRVGYPEDINEDTYPPEEWTICYSYQTILEGVKKVSNKQQAISLVRVAIRNYDWEPVAESMIAAFFYLLDHFPLRIKPEYLDGSENELRLWRVLLGLIIGGISGGEGSIKEAMDEHIASLDLYIDRGAKDELAQGEIFVNDVYQLLYYMIEVLSKMSLQTSSQLSTMYDKRLMVLRYVMRDVTEGIIQMLFRLQKSAAKKELTYEIIVKDIYRSLKTDIILALKNNKNNQRHTEVNTISVPGDHKFFKVTSNIVLQGDSGGSSASRGVRKIDKSKLLHASIAEVASYSVLPKSEPSGRSRINPWAIVDNEGFIHRNPKYSDLIDSVQKLIERDD